MDQIRKKIVRHSVHVKRCSKCKAVKKSPAFCKKSAHTDRLHSWCRECQRKQLSPSRIKGTLSYFKTTTWARLQQRTVNGTNPQPNNPRYNSYFRNGVRIGMSKKAFFVWCDKNKNQILGLYKRGCVPSLDRKDAGGHYSIENIRITTSLKNAYAGALQGGLVTRKAVVGASVLKGTKIEFESLSAAAKSFGVRISSISRWVRAGQVRRGYKWGFKSA